MKDAFDRTIKVGDKVLYSTNTSAGTEYTIGRVIKKMPDKPLYRLSVKPIKTTKSLKPGRPVVIYAANAIVLPLTGEEE